MLLALQRAHLTWGIVTNKSNPYHEMYVNASHPRNREVKQMVERLYAEGVRKSSSAATARR